LQTSIRRLAQHLGTTPTTLHTAAGELKAAGLVAVDAGSQGLVFRLLAALSMPLYTFKTYVGECVSRTPETGPLAALQRVVRVVPEGDICCVGRSCMVGGATRRLWRAATQAHRLSVVVQIVQCDACLARQIDQRRGEEREG
jgi:hypothetical protein